MLWPKTQDSLILEGLACRKFLILAINGSFSDVIIEGDSSTLINTYNIVQDSLFLAQSLNFVSYNVV